MTKKSGGMGGMKTVLAWTLGVAIIAIVLLIMLIIFGNLQGNTGIPQDTTSYVNQTINLSATGNTPAGASGRIDGSLSSVVIVNASNGSYILTIANYTIAGVVINASVASEFNDKNVNVTYAVAYDSEVEIQSADLIRNYTKGATNTSTQFPVVGTIIGVALLLLILIGVLLFAITKLGGVSSVGGNSFGGSGGSGGGRSGRFHGSSSSSVQ